MFKDLLDPYALTARAAPALWAIVPLYIALIAVVPPLRDVEATALTSVAALIAIIFLADMVRERGKSAERELFRRWRGKPTTRRLRLIGAEDQVAVRELRELIRSVSGRSLPDESLERHDPARADAMYEDAVAVLRERTRGHPVVFSELTSYGRKRNTWAIRHFGRATAALGFGLCGLALLHPDARSATGLLWPGAGAGLDLLLTGYWFLEVREQRVQSAAERYANALFSASTANTT